MSRGKKIALIIIGIIAVLVIGVVGVGAKLYFDVSNSVKKTYETVERESIREEPISLKDKDAFSVLLMGIDTGDLGRIDQGRSDSLMIATVNPKDDKTTIVSIPRDTYVDIVGYGTQDKINHAYAFGGAAMSMDTVQQYLDIPVDHYIAINMKGIKELVDALGGVDVKNQLKFDYDGYTYDIGKIHLNGDQALGFSRMRYDDPNGDYGRQDRQRELLSAISQKLLSLEGITQYQQILNSMENNVMTDMDFSTMQKIVLDYRDAFTKIADEQMIGEGFMQDGISYQRVTEQELQRVQTELKKQLNLTN